MLTRHLSADLFYIPKSNLIRLFLSGVARRIAVTLLVLFSPIYIYQVMMKFGMEQPVSIVFVFVYYLISFYVRLLTYIYSENLSQKVGFKGTIRLSLLPFFLFLPCLLYASTYPVLFVVAAGLWGIHTGFFWWGYHGYFIKSGEKGKYGESIGEAAVFETLALIVTPALGALIVSLIGFFAVFIFSAVFMAGAMLFLGKDHDKRQRIDIKFGEVVELMKRHKSISLAYAGSGSEGALYYIVWPLFLYLFFGQVMSIGVILSASALIAAIFGIFAGRWDDKKGERKIVSYGVPLVTASWVLRIIQKSFSVFVVADSLWNLGQRMVGLPLNALTYRKGLEGGSARAILFRETSMIIGILISFLILILWLFLGGSIMVSFVLAGLLSTFPLLAVYQKRFGDRQ